MNTRTALTALGTVLFGLGSVLGVLTQVWNYSPLEDVPLSAEAAATIFVSGGVGLTVLLLLLSSAISPSFAAMDGDASDSLQSPGDDLNELLELSWHSRPLSTADRVALQERIQETTIQTVAQVENVPRAEAQATVNDGAWTTDVVATAFVSSDRTARYTQTRIPVWKTRLFRQDLSRTVTAVLELADQRPDYGRKND